MLARPALPLAVTGKRCGKQAKQIALDYTRKDFKYSYRDEVVAV